MKKLDNEMKNDKKSTTIQICIISSHDFLIDIVFKNEITLQNEEFLLEVVLKLNHIEENCIEDRVQ